MKKNPPPIMKPDTAFKTLDELEFMQECATRFNALILKYPEEAQRILRAYVTYKHELAKVYEDLPQGPGNLAPGITFGALFAAILQTHHGTGYYLRPVMEGDKISKLEVVRQSDDESVEKN